MKVRYTMTATFTANITKKALKEDYGLYPVTIEEAIRIDIANFKDDPYLFLDDAKINVFGEVIGK